MTKTNILMINHNPIPSFIVNFEGHSTKKPKHSRVHIETCSNGSDADTQRVASEKQRRTRKSHTKVRTGCLTCKIRRKKCDEAKPSCLRCTSTGRKCDGYAPTVSPTSQELVPSVASTTSKTPISSLSPNHPVVVETRIRYTAELNSDCDYGTKSYKRPGDDIDEEEVEDFILTYGSSTASINSSHVSSPYRSPDCYCDNRRHLVSSATVPATFLPRAPDFFATSPITDLEAHCFSYFRYRTGPQFASYFDSSIWRTYTIRSALAHPVLFSVAVALGAVHRRFTYGISREGFEYCGHAVRLHAKAVKQLKELKSQQVNSNLIGTKNSGGGGGMGVYDRDVIMVAEMLLGLFEAFQGEYTNTVSHMNNGLRYLLGRPMTLCHTESRYCAVESKPNVFCRLFHRIHMRAMQLFGSPTNILVKWEDGLPLPPIPNMFRDIEEARDFLFTEVDWIMHAPSRVWQDVNQRSDAQSLHVTRLLKWSAAYAETVKDIERTSQQKRACILLKLTRNATYLLLYLTLFVAVDTELPRMSDMSEDIDDDEEQDSGLAYATRALWSAVDKRDELNTNLARVKLLAEGILEEGGVFDYDEHSVSFDTSIGPPKTKEKVPEASNKTRHLVKQPMKQRVSDETLWEMLGVYGVAERISAVEEHAVIEAIRDIIPEHIDPRWVDITCMMESRKILLRYCRPDEYGFGMMWTQEWWAF